MEAGILNLALLPKCKTFPAGSAAFHGSSTGLQLFRLFLWAFAVHGRNNLTGSFCSHSLLSPRLATSPYYSEELVKLPTSLYSGFGMLAFCFQCSNCPAFIEQKSSFILKMKKWQLVPGKQPRFQVPTWAQSGVKVSGWTLPIPAWLLGKGFQTY